MEQPLGGGCWLAREEEEEEEEEKRTDLESTHSYIRDVSTVREGEGVKQARPV